MKRCEGYILNNILIFKYFQENILKPATNNIEVKEQQSECAVGSSRNSTEEVNKDSAGSSSEKPSTIKPNCDKPVDKDARMCKICYNSELRMVFMPCGHLIACAECAKAMKICAVCRQPVKASVQAFIS